MESKRRRVEQLWDDKIEDFPSSIVELLELPEDFSSNEIIEPPAQDLTDQSPMLSNSNNVDNPSLIFTLFQQLEQMRQENEKLQEEIEQLKSIDSNKRKAIEFSLPTNWKSFLPQSEIAISIWMPPRPCCKSQCPGNILVECNENFSRFLGRTFDFSQQNFKWRDLHPKKLKCCQGKDNPGGKPKAKNMQIVTAFGFKSVNITIAPLMNKGEKPKCYMVYIML